MQIKLDEAKMKITLKSIGLLGKKAKESAKKELGASAIDMLGESAKTLRKNNSIATSFLINSGKVQEYDKGYTVGYSASYAWAIEFGRKAGTVVPVKDLIPWVKKKLRINKKKDQERVAFFVSRAIFRFGTKAKPFFYPAYEKVIKGISGRIINAVNNALR